MSDRVYAAFMRYSLTFTAGLMLGIWLCGGYA